MQIETLKDIPGIVDTVYGDGRIAVYTGEWEWWRETDDGQYEPYGDMTEDEALRHLF